MWCRVQDELRAAVTDSTYHLWLEPLAPEALTGDTLLVAAPDAIRGWVADRFGRVLQSCAAAVLGPRVTVQLIAPGAGSADPEIPARTGQTEPTLNPKYTFGQFVIGDGNRLAHAAALAVAENPGHAYNPLFVYGPPGLGKTHLLHAIGNYVEAHGGGLTVRYATAEAFTEHFVHALRGGDVEAFKNRYRRVDVLLVDDVQFLESKARTETEFFHTFNALYEAGSQVVVTSDRMPRNLAALEDRLRERFESGLVTDVQPPDLPTRLTILRMRARRDGLRFDDESPLGVIAERAGGNVRALEGALIRVVAFHSLSGRPITAELASEVMDRLGPPREAPRRTLQEIQRLTAEAFGISTEELVSASRTAAIAWPRQVAMYLSRELTGSSLPAIGRAFGNRNHTTVLHACRAAGQRIAHDDAASQVVRELTERLEAPR